MLQLLDKCKLKKSPFIIVCSSSVSHFGSGLGISKEGEGAKQVVLMTQSVPHLSARSKPNDQHGTTLNQQQTIAICYQKTRAPKNWAQKGHITRERTGPKG